MRTPKLAVLVLNERNHDSWSPFGKDMHNELKDGWDDLIGFPKYLELYTRLKNKNIDIEECKCVFPKRRPVNINKFDNCWGCVLDLDCLCGMNSYLVQEKSKIPNNYLVCCISSQDGNSLRNDEKLKNFLERDNVFFADNNTKEDEIPAFLGGILAAIVKKYDPDGGGNAMESRFRLENDIEK